VPWRLGPRAAPRFFEEAAMTSFVLHWAVLALALWLTSQIVPGVTVAG
jgi:hypothetical protein